MNLYLDLTLIALVRDLVLVLVGLSFLLPVTVENFRRLSGFLTQYVPKKKDEIAGSANEQFEQHIQEIADLAGFMPNTPPSSFDETAIPKEVVENTPFYNFEEGVETITDAQEKFKEERARYV